MRHARVRRPAWALAAVLATAGAIAAQLGATTIARRAPSTSPTSRAHEAPLTVHDQGGGPAGGTVSSLVALATTPPTLVAAFEHGGVLRTSDRGRTWTAIDRGLPDDASCELTAPAASVTELYAECGGDLFKTENRGAIWRLLDLNDAVAPAIAPSDSRLLYELPYLTARSVDGGQRWSDVQSDWSTRAVAIDPANARRLYRLTDDELASSMNGGTTWRRVARSPAADVEHLVIDPSDSRVMFAASGDGTLFKTTSRGTLWFRAGDGLTAGSIDRLQFSGALMLALQDGVLLHSDDAGEHWMSMPRPAADEVTSFAANAAAPSTVFAATASGLFVTDDLGRRWVRLGEGVNRAAASVAVHDATTRRSWLPRAAASTRARTPAPPGRE